MSDEITTLTQIEQDMLDWRNNHLDTYLRTGGAEGHIWDISSAGGYETQTTLLLRTVGAKSGKERLSPLIYGDIGGEFVIVGSRGGAPEHPSWYHNIRSGGEVAFQVATQAFRAAWREPQGAERDKVWAFMADIFPPYLDYQSKTERPIPLIMMRGIERIPVFTA